MVIATLMASYFAKFTLRRGTMGVSGDGHGGWFLHCSFCTDVLPKAGEPRVGTKVELH